MTEPRHFIEIADWTSGQLQRLLDLAGRVRDGAFADRPLEGRTVAMIFQKPSTRTRVSTEVGVAQLGGHALMISELDSQMGRGESVSDTARVLSRYVDAILIRTFGHERVVEFARHATVPVVNGLTDLVHPCQVMADLMTIVQEFGPDLSRMRVVWIGDGNNMANSWLNAARRFGFALRLACPPGYEPDPRILDRAPASRVELARDPERAAEGAHVVTTDVWASMGAEGERKERAEAFARYQVDEPLMARAHPEAIFLHCLPAHRGEEVAPEVIDGPRSRIFREAENRLHIIKAILLELIR
ncbi:MAG: ornithine carbamoyltransferase [Gemmatimonadetes bacterium]|nr:ornithine carbamoyltransferase [Gemmatimonadota bacterium]